MLKRLQYCIAIFTALIAISCGGSKGSKSYQKSAIDKIIVEYMDYPTYSVILADMDYDESTDKYKHKYKVLLEKAHQSTDSLTQATDVEVVDKPWQVVSDVTFNKYKENLGMTILSKKDGKLDKIAAPAGFDNYVGNKRYGRWQTNSSGGSFWVFYGQYRFLSDLFLGPRYYYPHNDWNTYNRNYRGRQAYYGKEERGGGSSGSTRWYGTGGSRAQKSNTWSKKPSSFKSRVNSKVSKSASRTSAKRSRSSSRYSSSGSRSRSGGYGK